MGKTIDNEIRGERSVDCLRPGGVGRIRRVSDTGISGVRLGILGFLPGQILKLARTAPLGDPIAVDINGTRIGLRLSEARSIVLEPEEESDGQGS